MVDPEYERERPWCVSAARFVENGGRSSMESSTSMQVCLHHVFAETRGTSRLHTALHMALRKQKQWREYVNLSVEIQQCA
jgi:hypothetical protein